MTVKRYIEDQILQYCQLGKVIVIYGPRQVGKTTLLKQLEGRIKNKIFSVSGEDRDVQKWLGSQSIAQLKIFVGDTETLIIDEAQHIPQIGLNLKIMVDNLPNLQIIASGSSSFELANQFGEPLVGRKWQFTLLPFAQLELSPSENIITTKNNLPLRLIYGSYPEVTTTSNLPNKKELLNSILDNHLFKDLLALENIRHSDKLFSLLKLLAFQIGQEVSLRELSVNLGLSVATVERYLDLLEKVFIIQRVGAFSRNLRKEIAKSSRYYFIDNGVRNSIISNFNDLDTRNDVGQLWENYLFMERLKKRLYQKIYANVYFRRTYDKKEIDLVEERDGILYGYEFKWKETRAKAAKEWLATYSNAKFLVINQENYLDFIL